MANRGDFDRWLRHYATEHFPPAVAPEPRCADCGRLLKRVTDADSQCTCNEALAAAFVYEDILDAEVIG